MTSRLEGWEEALGLDIFLFDVAAKMKNVVKMRNVATMRNVAKIWNVAAQMKDGDNIIILRVRSSTIYLTWFGMTNRHVLT